LNVLDSRHWKLAESAPSLAFELDGDAIPTSRTGARRTWISSAEGVVARFDGGSGEATNRVWIAGECALSLRHSLPRSIDLGPLLGRRVRVTLVHVVAEGGAVTQTLTVTGEDRRVYLVAHVGAVNGIMHTLGALSVYVALSQRPGGPMVFGTARLQSLVRVGDDVRVKDGDQEYVLHFHSRGAAGASYVIASKDLWRL
jgi:hypothetical protein